jgi:hypothetical protein
VDFQADELLTQLRRLHAAIEFMTGKEPQDRDLTLEMSQEMIYDLAITGELGPLADYIGRYNNCTDTEAEKTALIAEAEAAVAAALAAG